MQSPPEGAAISSTYRNLLLDSLSAPCRERILSVAKHIPLPLRMGLIEADQLPVYAYFLTSGIASVVIELPEGTVAEVSLIANEGMVGAINLIGPALPPARTFIQVAGSGFRVPFHEMKKVFLSSDEVRSRVLEMVQQQTLTISQLVACNRLHDAESRLARWLLMVQDRVHDDTLMLTQEFLAQMLGTQRSTVVGVAGGFQRHGLISYSRGRIVIHSRHGLERLACDCYKITHRLLKRLYEDPFLS